MKILNSNSKARAFANQENQWVVKTIDSGGSSLDLVPESELRKRLKLESSDEIKTGQYDVPNHINPNFSDHILVLGGPFK